MTTNQDGPNTAGAAEPVADGERIGLAVWCDSIADHHADVLTPRQIEKLYAASDALRALSQRPSVDPAAYAVMNPTSGGISATSTGQLYNASASVVPDEVVEAMGEALFALSDRLRTSGFLISDFNHASYERVVKAWGALTAAIPAIKAQVLAEIVAYLRMGEHVHSRSGSIESERVFKLIADAIERGEHEND